MPSTERFYTLGLNLIPERIAKLKPAGGIKGSLSVVAEDVDQEVYDAFDGGIGTLTHKGRVQVGTTAAGGVLIQMSYDSLAAMNQGINEILLIGLDLVQLGLKGAALRSDKPRSDLYYSLSNLTLLTDDSVPHTSNMSQLPQAGSTHEAAKNDFSIRELLETARLIPHGYKAELRKKLDKETK